MMGSEYTNEQMLDFMHDVMDWRDSEDHPIIYAIIETLKQIQQYRAIGLVPELIGKMEEYKPRLSSDTGLCKHCSDEMYNDCQKKECVVCVFDKAIEIVKDFIKDCDNGWIPCSERLPEKGGTYIVCSEKQSVYVAHFYKNSVVPHWSKGNIIYWQPLPEPHQKGSE